MTKMSKREYLIELKQKYYHADRQQKIQLLNDFCDFTKYHRKSALRLIHQKLSPKWKHPPVKVKYYDQETIDALLILWRAADEICGERFQPFIPELLKKMTTCGEIQVTDEIREKLLQISIGHVKRIIRQKKRISTTKIKGTTRPGTLLKHQIAIRFGPWEEVDPGYFEMDTVAHSGETIAGSFIYSLDLVDIATGWTEQAAIWGKGERATLEQFKKIEKRLPFKILGIDPDNGSEFINWHMLRHCQKNKINFTRSRAYHKNDNAHVEQKNWTAVRQLVGYDRLDKKKQLEILNDLYTNSWRLYINFFQPTMKLKEKIKDTKTGKTKKKYYEAKTPYQRILEHKNINKETKKMLKAIYNELNPVKLKLEINQKLSELRKTLK
jgi:hypothetical protein